LFGHWQMDAIHDKGANRGLIRRIFTKPPILGNLEPLFQAMDDVARRHQCSYVQVALNWLLTTDPHVVPIPGAKNVRQLSQNLASLDWRMTVEERESINVARARVDAHSNDDQETAPRLLVEEERNI